MKSLRVLSHELNQCVLQKMSMSPQCLQYFNLHIAKYAIVQYLKSYYICKVYENNDLSDGYCHIDKSVEILQCYKDHPKQEALIQKSISAVSNIYNFSTLVISIVFNTADQSIKWESKIKTLLDLIKKYILKIFVFTTSCKIHLRSETFPHNLGIKEIIVHTGAFTNCSDIINHVLLGKVTHTTKIKILNIRSFNEYKHLFKNARDLQVLGLQKEYNRICEIININKYVISTKQTAVKPLKQILIIGPSGVGKTLLIYAAATNMRIPIVSVNASQIVKQDPGESEKEIRNIFHEATQLAAQGSICILLLDELETLCPRISASSGAHVARISTQLLSLLDKANLIPSILIIGISNNSKLLNPGLRRPGRMDTEIFIRLPSENDRLKIFEYWISKLFPKVHNNFNTNFFCKIISRLTPGYTGSDIELVCQKVLFQISRTKTFPNCFSEYEKIFRETIQNTHSGLPNKYFTNDLKQCQSTVKNIGGSDEIIDILRRSIEWPIRRPHILRRMGLPQSKGLLMYGPPGCAKTSLACAIAKEVNFCFFNISAAQLYSCYVGVAEETLMTIFQQARQNAPSIVFIDEIDSIMGSRSSDTDRCNDVQTRLLSTLLMEMDGVGISVDYKLKTEHCEDDTDVSSGVFVLAATNRPDAIDSALMRPGRFDRILYVPPPNKDARLGILKLITSDVPLDSDMDFETLACDTKLYSGADLTKLCKEAILEAMTTEGLNISKVKFKYFQNALAKNKPSLSSSQIAWYDKYKV